MQIEEQLRKIKFSDKADDSDILDLCVLDAYEYTSRVVDLTGKEALDDIAGINQIETRPARKERDRFLCDQELYRRELPDGSYSFAWVLHDLFDGS